MKINIGNDLYLKGRIGWKGLSKDEYLEVSDFRIINGYSLREGYIDWDIAGYISEERYLESPEIMLEIGDILISKDGTIGKVGIVRELNQPTTVASGIFVLRNIIKDKLDTEYLFQYLKSSNFKNFINRVKAEGSTINHLYQRDLISLELKLPSPEIQKKISKTLYDLDAKIELNNKINAELEAMAKTIYDYWFVQFDFPFDFAQGRPDANGKPYKTGGGKMVWNEELKRDIPEGWEVLDLSDIAKITMGQSPPGESYNEEGDGIVFYQGCTDFGNRFPTIRKYTTAPTRFAKQGDILLSVRAPVGTMNIAKENCCIGRGLASLHSKDNCIAYLFGVMVNLKQIFDRRNVDGTTFGSITKDDLFSLKVIKPSKEVLLQFDKIVNPCFEKQNKLEQENIELASLRDWLLPMLMNGQVSVGDALRQAQDDELGMVAEPKSDYKSSNDTFNEIFNQLNYDYEIAAVVSLTFQRFKCYYGKKYIHKMFSNIQMLNTLPVFKELTFQENGWGMFSPQIKKAIEDQKFVKFGEIKDNQKVLEVNIKYLKEIGNWIKDEENKAFVSQVNDMLTIYESPTINKKMDNIELFNTVLECMKVLKTDNFEAIYDKMKAWPMKEEGYETKADKFTKMQTKGMILFIKEIKK